MFHTRRYEYFHGVSVEKSSRFISRYMFCQLGIKNVLLTIVATLFFGFIEIEIAVLLQVMVKYRVYAHNFIIFFKMDDRLNDLDQK